MQRKEQKEKEKLIEKYQKIEEYRKKIFKENKKKNINFLLYLIYIFFKYTIFDNLKIHFFKIKKIIIKLIKITY